MKMHGSSDGIPHDTPPQCTLGVRAGATAQLRHLIAQILHAIHVWEAKQPTKWTRVTDAIQVAHVIRRDRYEICTETMSASPDRANEEDGARLEGPKRR
jgi:hypothetical protein